MSTIINNNEKPLRVAFYLRVSTDDQVEKFGIALQEDALYGLLKSKGKLSDGSDALVLAGEQYIYRDDGISGITPADERPGFARLKDDILLNEIKPFDLVATYKIDRFARRLKILLEVVDFFEEHNINFISAHENIDTSTPFGRAMLGIMGVIAELEIETTKERTHAGRADAAKSGVFMGSVPPFGYKKDADKKLVVLEEEANVVKEIFSMFVIERKMPDAIARYLTDHDYISPEASAVKYKKKKESRKKEPATFWRGNFVRNLLVDEIYIGKYYYNKHKDSKQLPKEEWKLSNYLHEKIIDIGTFSRAQEIYKELGHMKVSKENSHVYLLSGLLKCDCCYNPEIDKDRVTWSGGRDKVNNTVPIKYSYHYKCGRKNTAKTTFICNTIPLPANDIENYVVQLVFNLLANPKIVYDHYMNLKSTKKEINHLESKIRDYEKLFNAVPTRRDRLLEQHKLSHIDTDNLNNEMKKLGDSEKKWKKELDALNINLSKIILSQGYEAGFEIFNSNYKRALSDIVVDRNQLRDILRMLVARVVVYSRPLKGEDVISGKKKEGQLMPFGLDIQFKLPKEFLRTLFEKIRSGEISPKKEFAVRNTTWWARRESVTCLLSVIRHCS